MIPRSRALAAAALIAAIAAAGCGKRGSPLAPFVRIPGPVETIAAARVGNAVHVTLTVPATNIDKSVPADITRIDVYGYTGRVAPSRAQWAALGTVVGSVPVHPLPADENGVPIPRVIPSPEGATPGTPVMVIDRLTAEELVQGPLPPVDPRVAALPPLPDVVAPTVLRRFYLAIPFARNGRPGPPGAQAEFVITQLPDPPAALRVSYLPAAVSLTWEPSGGLLGFLLDRALPPEPLPFDVPPPLGLPAAAAVVADPSVPPGPTTYTVYRESGPDPFVLPPALPLPWRVDPPVPLNPAPIAATTITDVPDFGRLRCYTVRAQRGAVMSEPSPRACVVPVDVFPPAAPTGLAAVPSEGGISLIWEPNDDPDLGGYLVLRRDATDATLRQLTPAPIAESRYRDADVKPGARYIYSVVAVDSQVPLPNASPPSAAVEETAR